MLSLNKLKKTSELFGTVELNLTLSPCNTIVNDWKITIDGSVQDVTFISSTFPECSAIFQWDTTKYKDGPQTIIGYANNETTVPITVLVNNTQTSYRVLNKKLINAKIIAINNHGIEIELSKDIEDFLYSLPGQTGYIDQEMFATEKFDAPFNGKETLIGNTLIRNFLDITSYQIEMFGDILQIIIPEMASKYLLDFINPEIQIGIANSTTVLTGTILIITPNEFPATNTKVFVGE